MPHDGTLLAKYDPWEEGISFIDTSTGQEISSSALEVSATLDGLKFAFGQTGSILFVWSEWGIQAISARNGISMGELEVRATSDDFIIPFIERFDVSETGNVPRIGVAFGNGEVALYSFSQEASGLDLTEIHRRAFQGRIADLELLSDGASYAVVVDIDEGRDDRGAEVHVFHEGESIFSEQILGLRGISNIGVNSALTWAAFSSMETVNTINLGTGDVETLSYHGLNSFNNTPPPIEFLPDGGGFLSEADFESPFSSAAGLYELRMDTQGAQAWQKSRELDFSISENISVVQNGAYFLTSKGQNFVLASTEGGFQELPIKSGDDIKLIASSPSGNNLATHHADGFLRVWLADPFEQDVDRLLFKKSIGAASCIEFIDELNVVFLASGDSFALNLDTNSNPEVTDENCTIEDQSRFSFRDRALIDNERNLEVDINQSLGDSFVVVRELSSTEDTIAYMIHHADWDTIGVWQLAADRSRILWSVEAFLMLSALGYLSIEITLLFRRRSRKRI